MLTIAPPPAARMCGTTHRVDEGRPHHVDVEAGTPFLNGRLEPFQHEDRGVVDQHRRRTERSGDRLDRTGHLFRIADVGIGVVGSLPRRGNDLLGCGASCRRLAIDQANEGSLACEHVGDRAPDSLRGARDDRHLALERTHRAAERADVDGDNRTLGLRISCPGAASRPFTNGLLPSIVQLHPIREDM